MKIIQTQLKDNQEFINFINDLKNGMIFLDKEFVRCDGAEAEKHFYILENMFMDSKSYIEEKDKRHYWEDKYSILERENQELKEINKELHERD